MLASDRSAQIPFETDHLKMDLGGRSVRGGAVTMTAQAGKFLLQMVAVVVLARLLTPEDFGLVAMVTAVTNFVMMFKDMGLSSATVQRREINHAQVSTLFWINATIGSILALVTVGLAPAISWFYGEPKLGAITMVLAVALVLSGLTIQHQALLRRQMRFVALGTVEVVAMLLGIICAIVAAALGASYWSLIVWQIVMAAAHGVGVWAVCGWWPGWPHRHAGVRPMVAFGKNVTGFHLVNYFGRNTDNILLGRFWGSQVLGLYSRAYSLLMLPTSQLTVPLAAVAMPALSRIQDDARKYAEYYIRFVRVLAFFSMPLVALLAICSESAIILLLGEQWVAAAQIFRILAIAAFIQPISSTTGAVLLSMGQSGRLLAVGIFNSVIVVASFIIGLPWGAVGVAAAYAIATYVVLLPNLWYSFRKTPISPGDFLRAISQPAVASLAMAGGALGVLRLIGDQPEIVTIGSCSIVGAGIYLLTWMLMPGGAAALRETRGYLRLLVARRA